MSGHGDLTNDVDIDIAGLLSNIWKMKWMILILCALAGGGIFMVMTSISPRYQTTAQLIIESRESQFTRVEQTNGGFISNEFDAAAVLSQVQIILSDSIALSTIKKLDLAVEKEFQIDDEPSMLSDLLVVAGLKNDSIDVPAEDRVLKAFKKRLSAYSVEKSRVIEILFWANDPKLAKVITNTIADEYLQLQRNSKLETDSNASKFLEPEIRDLRGKVRAAEAKVAAFRSNSDILLGTNNGLLATQQLSEVSTELSRVRAQRSAAQAKVEAIRSTLKTGGSLEVIPEVAGSPLIQRLRERQVQLRAQISELSTTLLSAHPRLKALKSQVADFEKQILREARGILTSLENNVVIASSQEKSLTQELSRVKSEAARVGGAEVELRALEREAVSQRELLQAYMIKFREVAGRQSSKYQPINARVISAAHLPTESFFPKTVPYTIAGTVVTGIMSIVGILALSLLSGKAFNTVNARREVGESANIDASTSQFNAPPQPRFEPELNQTDEIAQSKFKPDIAMPGGFDNPQRPDIETPASVLRGSARMDEALNSRQIENSFKLDDQTTDDQTTVDTRDLPSPVVSPPALDINDDLPTPMAEMDSGAHEERQHEVNDISISLAADGLLGMGNSRIAVVSPGGDEGSITTWLLARKLANAGKIVAVMDMTGSGTTSQHMLGNSDLHGIRDMLAGKVELSEIICRDRHSAARVIPAGTSVPSDANAAQERLNQMVDTLSKNHDYLIIDCGFADLGGIARIADANTVILVSKINDDEASDLENELIDIGYLETISVRPTPEEVQEVTFEAA